MKVLKLAQLASRRFPALGTIRTTRRQKRIALGIAFVADMLQLALAPLLGEGVLSPFDDVLDVITAGLLLLVLGRSWRIAFALGLELVPGAALFPTWTAVIATLPALTEPAESPALIPAA